MCTLNRFCITLIHRSAGPENGSIYLMYTRTAVYEQIEYDTTEMLSGNKSHISLI